MKRGTIMFNLISLKKVNTFVLLSLSILLLILLIGCGGESKDNNKENVSNNNESGLSEFELENGIGPVKKKLNLAPINKELSAEGEKIFETKCGTCHKLDDRYVGPAQRDVLQRVTPEYLINMTLNPDEMLKKHPRAKKMLAEYLTLMTNQNVKMKDALALLEYFRVLDEELKQNQQNQ